MSEIIVYTDGASSRNPGPAGVGIVVYKNKKLVAQFGKFIGNATNNLAEYTAVLNAVKYLKGADITEATIQSDSELLVKQFKGLYKVKNPALKKLHNEILSYKLKLTFVHIPREKNKIADSIAKYHSLAGE